MTRYEQIKEEADKRYFRMSQGVDYHLAPEMKQSFIAGAEWADKVPSQETEALLQTARNTFKTMAELIKITLKVLK